VVVNFDSARGLFLQASEQGDGEAARYLGLMSLRGKGVEKNSRDAMKWFTLAAERGDSLAKKNLQMLGKLY
jgi:TPR repeat protein